jgi:hypothetical protein
MIVNAGGSNVSMAKPLLHLGDVRLMIERVGGGRRPQRMRADLKVKLRRIAPHQLVNAICRDRAFGLASAVVADRAKQRTVIVGAVSAVCFRSYLTGSVTH